ncbi:hypothetical protein AB0J86_09955 [Micromonospora sp. NPDC049559]|uniref:hypothetical protein n=1 Tax=Micromonospora sp. NPDC049559 TaxID=3155923 RepID=UPI003442087A
MNGFQVQIDTLLSTGARIQGAEGHVVAARQRLDSEDTGGLGSGELEGAAEDFVDRWGGTLDNLAAALRGVRHKLSTTADLYRQSDLDSVQYLKGVPEPDLTPKGN